MTRVKNLIPKASVILAAFLVLTLWWGPALIPQVVANATLAPDTFATIAEKYSPAVVNISAQKTVKGGEGKREFLGPRPMPGPQDPFWDFFEKFFPDMPRDRTQRALGTGLIIDAKGLIITNDHVVKNADKIK